MFKENFYNYRSPSDMYKKLFERKGVVNEHHVYLIKEVSTKMKKMIKNVPEDNAPKIGTNKQIIDLVESILEFNNKFQLGQGIKILTLNQMLSRLPISSAQLKAGNNYEKLKNEFRQLLYSLYR